jgi:hypothetical protein
MGYPNPPLYYSAESWILSTWWLQEARQWTPRFSSIFSNAFCW